jgi:hypothetical protein
LPVTQNVFIIGDERVLFKLRSMEAVVREESELASEKIRIVVHTTRQFLVPRETGASAEALDERIVIDRVRKHVSLEIGMTGFHAERAVWQDKGTGIYGEFHRPFSVSRPGHRPGIYLHPGMRGRHFTERALGVAQPVITEAYAEAGHRIARWVG